MNKELTRLIDRLYVASIDHFVHWRRHIREYFWAILVALSIRAFVVTIYRIPTGSMIPTLDIGDTLIANRFYYGLKLPFTDGLKGFRLPLLKRPTVGDVVVFRAPREELHYFIAWRAVTEEAHQILKEINSASSFKRPLLIPAPYGIDLTTNYIFYWGRYQASPPIILHEDIYKRFAHKLEDENIFYIRDKSEEKLNMTYKYENYVGFARTFFDTPMAGTSILATVSLKSPFFYMHRLAFETVREVSADTPFKWANVQHNMSNFSLYPNRAVDMTKDFVKRIIADEGDTVEIINKVIYVNGVEYKHLGEVKDDDRRDPYGHTFVTRTELIDYKTKGGEHILLEHPVRFYKREYPPNGSAPLQSVPFLSNLFPFAPQYSSAAKDHSCYKDYFGPITVPKDHFFAVGDNRDNSLDSRFWGFVPRWAVKGTPMVVVLPPGRWGRIR